MQSVCIAMEADLEDDVCSRRVDVATEQEPEMRSTYRGSMKSKWLVCFCVKLIGFRAILHISSNSPLKCSTLEDEANLTHVFVNNLCELSLSNLQNVVGFRELRSRTLNRGLCPCTSLRAMPPNPHYIGSRSCALHIGFPSTFEWWLRR
jgi:hypothetical protein